MLVKRNPPWASTVLDVAGQDAAVSFVTSVQRLHGSIRSTLLLHYLHSQCRVFNIRLYLWDGMLSVLVGLTSGELHGTSLLSLNFSEFSFQLSELQGVKYFKTPKAKDDLWHAGMFSCFNYDV